MTWKYSELAKEIEAHDVAGKFVIIRVEDPQAYMASGDLIGRELKKRGAQLVIVARPEDKIETWDDERLRQMGLQRIPKLVLA